MTINRNVKAALVILGFMLATAAITEIHSLTTRLAAVEDTAKGLQSKVDEQSSEMDDMKSQIDDMKSEIDDLNAKAETQSSDIDGVKSDVDDIKTKLGMP